MPEALKDLLLISRNIKILYDQMISQEYQKASTQKLQEYLSLALELEDKIYHNIPNPKITKYLKIITDIYGIKEIDVKKCLQNQNHLEYPLYRIANHLVSLHILNPEPKIKYIEENIKENCQAEMQREITRQKSARFVFNEQNKVAVASILKNSPHRTDRIEHYYYYLYLNKYVEQVIINSKENQRNPLNAKKMVENMWLMNILEPKLYQEYERKNYENLEKIIEKIIKGSIVKPHPLEQIEWESYFCNTNESYQKRLLEELKELHDYLSPEKCEVITSFLEDITKLKKIQEECLRTR